MKAGELREKLNRLFELDEKNDELELAIVTSDTSIGARSYVTVKSATPGFDWETGLLMMTTHQKITQKTSKGPGTQQQKEN